MRTLSYSRHFRRLNAMHNVKDTRWKDVSAYASGMSSRHLGQPLLRPSPEKNVPAYPDIMMGDVGFIGPHDGTFYRLFNVTLPADHEVNRGRVPSTFVPIAFDEDRDTRSVSIPSKVLTTGLKSIKDEYLSIVIPIAKPYRRPCTALTGGTGRESDAGI